MAAQGAKALFIPTNNGLPLARASASIVDDARRADVARATENDVYVIRADVAGRTSSLLSYGSTAIVDPRDGLLASAQPLVPDLLVVDIDDLPRDVRAPYESRVEGCLSRAGHHACRSARRPVV